MTNLVTCMAFLAMNGRDEDGVDLKFSWDDDQGFSVMVDIDPSLERTKRPKKPVRFYSLTREQVRNTGRLLIMLADMHDDPPVNEVS